MMEALWPAAAKILESLPVWISVPLIGLGMVAYAVRQERRESAARMAQKDESQEALLKSISGNVGRVLTIVEDNKGEIAIIKDRVQR